MDIDQKSREIPETLTHLLNIFQKGFKAYTYEYEFEGKKKSRTINSTFEIAEHEQKIILTDSEYISFLVDFIRRPFAGEPPEAEKCRNELTGYNFKYVDQKKTGLRFALEITTPDGETVYLISKSDYPKIQQNGVQNRNAKVQKLVDEYFKKHQSKNIPPEEYTASKAITGEIEYIIPLLYGLKPAAVTDNADELETTELKTIPYKSELNIEDNEVIIFNPEAVKKTVTDNPDIFSAIGINNDMPAEEVIKKTLGLTDSLTESTQASEVTKAVGLLLGFDKTSVLNYGNSSKAS